MARISLSRFLWGRPRILYEIGPGEVLVEDHAQEIDGVVASQRQTCCWCNAEIEFDGNGLWSGHHEAPCIKEFLQLNDVGPQASLVHVRVWSISPDGDVLRVRNIGYYVRFFLLKKYVAENYTRGFNAAVVRMPRHLVSVSCVTVDLTKRYPCCYLAIECEW